MPEEVVVTYTSRQARLYTQRGRLKSTIDAPAPSCFFLGENDAAVILRDNTYVALCDQLPGDPVRPVIGMRYGIPDFNHIRTIDRGQFEANYRFVSAHVQFMSEVPVAITVSSRRPTIVAGPRALTNDFALDCVQLDTAASCWNHAVAIKFQDKDMSYKLLSTRLSPTGRTMATDLQIQSPRLDFTRRVGIFDIERGEFSHLIDLRQEDQIRSLMQLAFIGNNYLAVGLNREGGRGELNIYDVTSGELVQSFDLSKITRMSGSPDGRRLIVASRGLIHVFKSR